MRPHSEIRVDMAAALVDGPGTVVQLAQRTGWSIGLTRKALDNMAAAGDAVVLDKIRVPGIRRRVPLYAKASRRSSALAPGHAPLAGVLAGWLRWPSYAQPLEEAAMT